MDVRGVTEKRKFGTSYILYATCNMTVERPIASQKSVRYQAIENFIRKNHHNGRYEWSCRYYRGEMIRIVRAE